jgi:hypothetical protein
LKEYAEAENLFVTINKLKRIMFRYFFDGTLSDGTTSTTNNKGKINLI